jgi:hypothetical protein
MTKSVCFVLMPFGVKMDAAGRSINFDHVYGQIFKPAVIAAGLLPVRADEEQAQGFIHKLMYERLLLSEYAIADLTILNANVYYELGVRHAAKPATTVMTMAGQSGLPFDVAGLRVLPYSLDAAGSPVDASNASTSLADLLLSCIAREFIDSPIYQLVDGMKPPPIDPAHMDIFRERTAASEAVKARLASARISAKMEAVASVEDSLGPVSELEASVALDLLVSYRAVGAHQKMIDIIQRLDRTLSRTTMVRELLAFAQNKLGLSREAEETLKQVISIQGPSSETNGLLGSVYKARWEKAAEAGETYTAKACLKQAINAYVAGFEADWRDAYPGVNALTLMEVADDRRRVGLLPVVRYSSERRITGRGQAADYWDYATRFEIAAVEDDPVAAADMLGQALSVAKERWQLETTRRNLRFIANARMSRKTCSDNVSAYIDELTRRIDDWSF